MNAKVIQAFRPLVAHVDVLILFSLWVTLARTLLFTIIGLMNPSWGTLTTLGLCALVAAQIHAFFHDRALLWKLSAIQVVSVFFLSIGTFGYVLDDVISPLSYFLPGGEYVLAAALVGSEALKTMYFYRRALGT